MSQSNEILSDLAGLMDLNLKQLNRARLRQREAESRQQTLFETVARILDVPVERVSYDQGLKIWRVLESQESES